MAKKLDPDQRQAVRERIDYYRELGIHDFYRREVVQTNETCPAEEIAMAEKAEQEPMAKRTINAQNAALLEVDHRAPLDAAAALRAIREDIGDCKRCALHKQGRKQIVFGVGNPHAELMFVGEAPGADEDEQGEPFVGRAGQLLNNMISAMGLKRESVYIANIVKCRPPGNRTPEREECDTCGPFLFRQIDTIQPKVIVALGAVAAKTLLGVNDTMANLRGHWYDYRGRKLAVTYHPAYLLRDPRQKTQAWKDLQMVMKELGLEAPAKK
jgi:uracil-DNA glycosylase